MNSKNFKKDILNTLPNNRIQSLIKINNIEIKNKDNKVTSGR